MSLKRVAAAVLLFSAVNAAARFAHVRWDLSRGGLYSLSAASRRVAAALRAPVAVTVYASSELPPEIAVRKDYAVDLLKEYAAASGGKIALRFVAVGGERESQRAAQRAGVTPVHFDIVAQDKYEQRVGFLGLTAESGSRKDKIGYIPSTENLEYDLAALLQSLSAPRKPILGVVTGYDDYDQKRLTPLLLYNLQTRYEVRDVSLSSAAKAGGVDPDVRVLFFIGPQTKVSGKDAAVLDEYLRSGRSLLLAVDAKTLVPAAYLMKRFDNGLERLLASRGITIEPTIVLDEQSMTVQVEERQGPVWLSNNVRYPPILLVKDLDRSQPVTRGIDALVFPFASPISLSSAAASSAFVLARSSERSWARRPDKDFVQRLYPYQIEPPGPSSVLGPFPLAAAFPGPPRLVVVGTSRFSGTPVYRLPQSNQDFVLNLADWLSRDADLISIRAKGADFHPLREIPAGAKALVRYLDLLLPPFGAALLGFYRWRERERRRKRARAEFGAKCAETRA